MKLVILIIWSSFLGILISPFLSFFIAVAVFFQSFVGFWKGVFLGWVAVKKQFDSQKLRCITPVWERHQARLDAAEIAKNKQTKKGEE